MDFARAQCFTVRFACKILALLSPLTLDVAGLDTTIAADVQGSIYESLGDIEKLPWVGIGFPMGSVSIILLVGRLYTEFEIKWLIIGFMTLFEAGSALCGAAPTATALVVGRVLAGMGGAGIYIGALTYISCFTSLRERPLYNATLGLSWGIGAILVSSSIHCSQVVLVRSIYAMLSC